MSDYPLWCVVPAAGTGRRFGGQVPKQYLPLHGMPLLLRTLERLASHPRVGGLMVALAEDDPHWPGIDRIGKAQVLTCIGGGERADSVLRGLEALPEQVDAEAFVLVHDAARPCVRVADIDKLIELGGNAEGGLLGAPLRDTLKRAGSDGCSHTTESREGRWRAFTPQMFRRGVLTRGLHRAFDAKLTVTDEAMAMERAGLRPLLVEGAEDNLKVTTPADFALAEFLWERTR
ncbi:2-C-methyl-D-erythritol 4-phosphate cytidylyltransferase [Oleiagrimonas sp. C23AA]|uniref:2-C-methyl-D-erythritol 4-phosphate cytidylyltransferase n=1 Tax=Oleiagrimonas sp. C23AA TaxID=2719047 RepID=UPI001421CD77|nr:2-C-methyl-D-erythritol 4-phosphate cytidylyltransferase [Oleiagrimonas sp. C23AA]NII09417.1 2-C-methyl-D-erythritol 4-phosphate cytidylyltransferase [Oleiagrimonas sp. C23AA]